MGVETTLTPGKVGQFDVVVDGEVIFSKHSEHRFPEPGEILGKLG